MGNSVIAYLDELSRMVYHAKTALDEKASTLVGSVPVENGKTVYIKFCENQNGDSVLVLNMPDMPENVWGIAKKYYLQLKIFLQWYYQKELPDPQIRDFRGHYFHDWEPDGSNLMLFYSLGKKPCSETEINDFVLGLQEKEEEGS